MLGIRSSLIFWYVCIPDNDQSVCQSVRAFPLACRVLAGVRAAVREHAVQEAVPLLLQQVLQHLPVLCVPSGYYGNKGECPCYNNWKTKRGGPSAHE